MHDVTVAAVDLWARPRQGNKGQILGPRGGAAMAGRPAVGLLGRPAGPRGLGARARRQAGNAAGI